MTEAIRHVIVAVPGPMRKSFIYLAPGELGDLKPGQRVLVPFGSARKIGFYLGTGKPQTGTKIKAVLEILDNVTLFHRDLFALCMWMADYYFANPADCLSAALPSPVRSRHAARYVWENVESDLVPESVRHLASPGKNLSAATIREIKSASPRLLRRMVKESVLTEDWGGSRLSSAIIVRYTLNQSQYSSGFFKGTHIGQSFEGEKSKKQLKDVGWTDHYIRKATECDLLTAVTRDKLTGILEFVTARENVAELELTRQQTEVYETVVGSLGKGFRAMLLHGVTGSGKTIVYCHLARKLLKMGKTVLVLTPEITLSGSTLAYFRGFFGDRVTVMHSAMSALERLASWKGIRSGEYRIVVGPRSAVFAPLEDLGLVIVDEEHDSSYKQDDPAPRFHGRDSAIMRAKLNNVPVLLGSATPSVESFYHASSGRYQMLGLSERPGKARLPGVRIVDMRTQRIAGDLPYISLPLKKEISRRLKDEEQVILYINRRGYSPYIKCQACGHVPGCPRCNVKLTFHKSGRKFSCHYCGHVEFAGESCRKCGSGDLAFMGAGTQKVEEDLPRLFDESRPVRLDSDTATGRARAYRILEKFANRDYNILLGTQMVTKGLDLAGVSLVGVLAADSELDLPDFRASERTFAKLVQVAGRSGRADDKGEVMIQTYNPELDLITSAASQDYKAFYEREIKSREEFLYPPFVRLLGVTFSSKIQNTLESSADAFREKLVRLASEAGIKTNVLGPVPCPLSFLKGKHRRHMLIKTKQIQKLVRLLTQWEDNETRFGLPSSTKTTIDVDPSDMM